jgi:hypothetical protein
MSLVPNGVHGVVVPVTKKTPLNRCITVGGQEFCLVKKKAGTPAEQAPGNGAPQGGNAGAPQGGNAGAPPADDAGAPQGGNVGAPQDGNAGAPPVDNAGGAGTDANANLEPGEHVCPVGYLVLDKPSKFGAFCEEVKGFPIPAGMESVERACPAGYIVLATPNKYKALCEPKEGFPGTPSKTSD